MFLWLLSTPTTLAAEPMDQCPSEKPEPERETLNEVPPEQSTGLVPEAVHPLETEALERNGCARLLPREEAERYPHAHEPGLGHLVSQQANQPLLFRKAKADEDQRRLCVQKRLLDPFQLLRIVLESKWGAVGLHALKTGIPSLEPPRGGRGHAGIPTEEKDRPPDLGSRLRQTQDEVAATNPFRHGRTGQA